MPLPAPLKVSPMVSASKSLFSKRLSSPTSPKNSQKTSLPDRDLPTLPDRLQGTFSSSHFCRMGKAHHTDPLPRRPLSASASRLRRRRGRLGHRGCSGAWRAAPAKLQGVFSVLTRSTRLKPSKTWFLVPKNQVFW